jgi:hypothetical protein
MSTRSVVPLKPLHQKVNLKAVWLESLTWSYAACVFNRELSLAEVREKTKKRQREFRAFLTDYLPYCSTHPESERGCHCPLASRKVVPNHQLVRQVMYANCKVLMREMKLWSEFERFRLRRDSRRSFIVIPWLDYALDPSWVLFGDKVGIRKPFKTCKQIKCR